MSWTTAKQLLETKLFCGALYTTRCERREHYVAYDVTPKIGMQSRPYVMLNTQGSIKSINNSVTVTPTHYVIIFQLGAMLDKGLSAVVWKAANVPLVELIKVIKIRSPARSNTSPKIQPQILSN